MGSIFISYSREDRESALRLAGALHTKEWSVFWDRTIPPGKTWREVIGGKLKAAQCIIVLWSTSSVDSYWVTEEAEVGRRRGILVPVLIEDVEPPLGFQGLQSADLSKWDGDLQDAMYLGLVRALGEMIGPSYTAPLAETKRNAEPQQEQGLRSEEEIRANPAGTNSEASPVKPPKPYVLPTKKILISASAILIIFAIATFAWIWRSKVLATHSAPQPLAQKETKGDAGSGPKPSPPSGMVYVPGGEFTMGRDAKDGGDEFEAPAHRAVVKEFFMDIYEVTRNEYRRCVADQKCRAPQGWLHGTYPVGTARQPVTGVTWVDANNYAKWLGKRLPTEEEWEYGARGTDGRRYPWGDEWRSGLANANGASSGLVNVGTYAGASPFGVIDMVGNAWEWTASNLTNYQGGSLEILHPGDFVIRGGTYASNSNQATTTFRRGWSPHNASDYSHTGFRCVEDLSANHSQ